MPFAATWIDPEVIILSVYYTKWSKPEKDKYHIVAFICELYQDDTNEMIYKTETHSQSLKTKLWLQKGKYGGWINQEFRINVYTLLYIK